MFTELFNPSSTTLLNERHDAKFCGEGGNQMCSMKPHNICDQICYVDAVTGDQFILIKFFEDNHSTHEIITITIQTT